ncbi:MAG: sulfatase-like hydrolase/transferase [Opitutaceae bacterium]|nr:sulfatase-like hydrolase/transferase [Opitutaceae bacterium]
MILADDLGWADLGHDGSKIDTPNLDRLAKEGTKLTRFHSSAPMCSPTRSALLTGRYPHSVGVPELASPTARGKVPVLELSHEAITIPEALGPAGYRNVMVGKWHLGYNKRAWPRTHGFDEFWGSLIGTPTFWRPKETYHNETAIEVPGYYTDLLTDKAIEYLKSTPQPGKPIFLYLAYNAPHYPLEAPPELVGKYRRRLPNTGLFAIYAAMVEQLDTGIGRVLAALDELGMTRDTLVVFTSDNGPTAELTGYGPEGADISNGPLREHKFSTHEGGIRVPFLARWPGKIPAGKVRDELAVTMDLMPTFLEAAGVTAKHEMNGRSILPLLTGGAFQRPEAVHWEIQHNAAVIRGEWKLVHQFWRPRPFLYRWLEDTGENNDLAEKNPALVQELMALHDQWKARNYPNPVPRVTAHSAYLFPMAEKPAAR